MWIALIIIALVFIIGKFLIDKNNQASKVTMEGGMRNKYRVLIEYLMSGDSRTRILNERYDSITVGLANMGGTTLFILTQTFGNVTVQWKIDSPVFGKHKMEWDFPEYGDQEKMMEIIANDLEKFQQNLMSSHGFR